MSIAIITIREKDNEDLKVNVEFDPPLKGNDDGDEILPTHALALAMLDAVVTPDDIVSGQ